jgi:hypothetical protein
VGRTGRGDFGADDPPIGAEQVDNVVFLEAENMLLEKALAKVH